MAWLKPVFNAADFTTEPSGLWTVRQQDVITLEYKLLDVDTMALNWVIGNTNVSGSPISLDFLIPDGYAAVSRLEPTHYLEEDSLVKFLGWFDVNPNDASGGRKIKHYKLANALGPVPWLNTANHDCSVHG